MEKFLRQALPDGQFPAVSAARSRTMAAIRGKDNRTTERKFRMALVRSCIRGWITHAKLPGRPDIFFPNEKIVIFLDGCFWHACSRCGHLPKSNSIFWMRKLEGTRIRDRKNTRLLRQQGLVVMRAWEHSIRNEKTLQQFIKKVERELTQRARSDAVNDPP
jgi:DNA mismatch endonuclease, patch repair protein